MDTIGGKRVVRDRQVIEKMVSAVGIEPTTYWLRVTDGWAGKLGYKERNKRA